MTRKTRGAAVALILMLASASTASAAQPTGGTSAQSTTTTAPATPDPAAPAAPATTDVAAAQTITLSRSQTKKVQRRVHVRADGAVGARTRTAIRRYQAKKRLTRTGRPNLETIRAMKMPFVAQVEQKLAAAAAGTDPEATTRQAPAAASGDLATAIAAARSAIGTPYSSGGTNTSGFDCSGLMVWAFDQAGIDLPRTSFDQYEVGTPVEQSAIQPGDLVFFSTAGPGASHVGVAVDATTVISATTRGVMAHKLNDDYWGAAYVGARRLAAGA